MIVQASKDIKPFPQPYQTVVKEQMYQLTRAFQYTWQGRYKAYFRMTIPNGFRYDGASIPSWAWSITGLRPTGLISAAACVHDYLYRRKGSVVLKSSHAAQKAWTSKGVISTGVTFNRKACDDLFLQIMKEAGIGWFKRSIAYRTVRMFGGKHFG